jgi:hypothetical protein
MPDQWVEFLISGAADQAARATKKMPAGKIPQRTATIPVVKLCLRLFALARFYLRPVTRHTSCPNS